MGSFGAKIQTSLESSGISKTFKKFFFVSKPVFQNILIRHIMVSTTKNETYLENRFLKRKYLLNQMEINEWIIL